MLPENFMLYVRQSFDPATPASAKDRVLEIMAAADTNRLDRHEVTQLIADTVNHLDLPALWSAHDDRMRAEKRAKLQAAWSGSLGGTRISTAADLAAHTGPPPALWGCDDEVLWADGQPLIIEAAVGVGKTTLAGLLVRAQLLGGDVLGRPVAKLPKGRRILYLALDRPDQIKSALARQFTAAERDSIGDQLTIFEGPLPSADDECGSDAQLFVDLCRYHGASVVYVDSLKDACTGLTEDRAAAEYNRKRQCLMAYGAQLVELHHLTKGGDDYGSVWLRAGAGSVVRLAGKAGGDTGTLLHMKSPAKRVAPIQVRHDRPRGEIMPRAIEAPPVAEPVAPPPVDLTTWLAQRPEGATAAEAAQHLRGSSDAAAVKHAKRALTLLVDAGRARVVESPGRHPSRWLPAIPELDNLDTASGNCTDMSSS